MLKLLRLIVVLAGAALALLVTTPVATAAQVTRFVAPLSAECDAAVASGATGVAFVTVNEATGRITYRVVAFNLPGTLSAAHIHGPINLTTGNGPVAVPLELTGVNSGVVASGTATDPALAAAIVANPANFYFNLHTTTCPSGALRGTLTPV
jgi:hypothetical protein